MAYVPNPADATQPIESVFASTAAAEFRALKAYIQSILSGAVIGNVAPGAIFDFPFNTPPPGYLVCDGTLINRATFATLWGFINGAGEAISEASWAAGNQGKFSVGDGATTFRLPDLRGTFRRSFDGGRGIDVARVNGSFQDDAVGSHQHRLPFGYDGASMYGWLDGANTPIYGSELNNNTSRGTALWDSAGSPFTIRTAYTQGDTFNIGGDTRPVNYAVLTCVKT